MFFCLPLSIFFRRFLAKISHSSVSEILKYLVKWQSNLIKKTPNFAKSLSRESVCDVQLCAVSVFKLLLRQRKTSKLYNFSHKIIQSGLKKLPAPRTCAASSRTCGTCDSKTHVQISKISISKISKPECLWIVKNVNNQKGINDCWLRWYEAAKPTRVFLGEQLNLSRIGTSAVIPMKTQFCWLVLTNNNVKFQQSWSKFP